MGDLLAVIGIVGAFLLVVVVAGGYGIDGIIHGKVRFMPNRYRASPRVVRINGWALVLVALAVLLEMVAMGFFMAHRGSAIGGVLMLVSILLVIVSALTVGYGAWIKFREARRQPSQAPS